jgi:hygromycin-B 7''-O-kinase
MPLLPTALTLEAYSQQFRQAQVWAPALTALAEEYAPEYIPEPINTGSAIVWRLGPDQILKLLPPFWQVEATTEQAALQVAQDRLSVAIPTLLASGELEGWPYLLLEALPGTPLNLIWPRLDGSNRQFLLQQLGELIQELRGLPIPPTLAHDWPQRIHTRQQNLSQRLAAHQFPAEIHPQLNTYYALHAPALSSASEPVFLHGDLTPEHLLVYQQNGRWELCGLIDFGEAFAGPACYEVIAPLIDGGLTEQERGGLWEYAHMEPPTPLLPWALSHSRWSAALRNETLYSRSPSATLAALESLLS